MNTNDVGTILCDRLDLAFIVAGLVREGVTFEAERQGGMGTWKITLTGGF